ncbi:MAG TPA: hypothetical protein VGX25_23190 [Actinophytocola sp.]|uniref:hypothetical protein n=1 Tax=Actinophytocola sp. TaxID=1872138 RepID=UPI002DDDB7F6|nr:hypothetical protein [Actinophytocola sp.]HEV2782307.1 hypothetical protein [Actinophytocola sp.]
MAAFGIDRDARLPFYQDRVRWAAEKIHRDDRTARRRIDEGIDRIAELAASSGILAPAAPPGQSPTGWHTSELRIAVALDQPFPEAFELRTVVADRDRVSELDLAVTLTAGADRGKPIDLDALSVDVFYGGTLVDKTLESGDRIGLVLALPEELSQHQRHDVVLRYRVKNDQMQPHYVCVPKHRCDLFKLWVRFGRERLPSRVWRLTNAFQRDVDDPGPTGEILASNAAGEVHTVFRELTPGRAYGVRWTPPSSNNVRRR